MKESLFCLKEKDTVFRFQLFSVCQKQSAMKICTDSLLFGAMAPLKPGDRVMDIGTGTGLLSLMAAQRGAAKVTAVELSEEAYQEASENFANSPWPELLESVSGDVRNISKLGGCYDLVISNPPFFEKHSPSSDSQRCLARHNSQLGYDELLECAHTFMSDRGLFYVLLPTHVVANFHLLAEASGLYLNRRADIQGRAGLKPKVAALTFSKQQVDEVYEAVVVYSAENVYSDSVERYLSPFLLRFREKRPRRTLIVPH